MDSQSGHPAQTMPNKNLRLREASTWAPLASDFFFQRQAFLHRGRDEIPDSTRQASSALLAFRLELVQRILQRVALCRQAERPSSGHEVELVAVPQTRKRGTSTRGGREHALPVSHAVEPEAVVSATGGVLADACENVLQVLFLAGRAILVEKASQNLGDNKHQ